MVVEMEGHGVKGWGGRDVTRTCGMVHDALSGSHRRGEGAGSGRR